MSDNKNVLGEKLETCGTEPLTDILEMDLARLMNLILVRTPCALK